MRILSVLSVTVVALAAPSGARAQTIVVDSAACRTLATHHPSPDVAYRPGVDVRGRPVAGADLAPSAPVLSPSFTFDLNVDLAPYLPAGSRLSMPQMGVGRVTLGPDGKVMFNGQQVGQGDGAALAAACRRVAPR
jgi:hypothetical protein